MSRGRDMYFERVKNKAKSAREYVALLLASPYATHRRIAKGLEIQLEHLEKLEEEQTKQNESSAFAKLIMEGN